MRIARVFLAGCIMTLVIAGRGAQAGAQGPLGCCLYTQASTQTCADMVTDVFCSSGVSGTFRPGGKCRGGEEVDPGVFVDGICAPVTPAPAMSNNVMLMTAAMLALVGVLRLVRGRRAHS